MRRKLLSAKEIKALGEYEFDCCSMIRRILLWGYATIWFAFAVEPTLSNFMMIVAVNFFVAYFYFLSWMLDKIFT